MSHDTPTPTVLPLRRSPRGRVAGPEQTISTSTGAVSAPLGAAAWGGGAVMWGSPGRKPFRWNCIVFSPGGSAGGFGHSIALGAKTLCKPGQRHVLGNLVMRNQHITPGLAAVACRVV